MPAGLPKLQVKFVVDADGIMRIQASEERSGTATEVIIKSQYGISEEQMGRMLMDSLQHAKEDMSKKALIDAQNEGRAMVATSEKFIIQNMDILTEEETNEMKSMSDEISAVLDGTDRDAILSKVEALNEYSRPLAERAMDHNLGKALAGKKLG